MPKRLRRLRKALASIGPGFITGAADDDPSGIATYAQTGAQFGYTQLWLALFTLPFMASVQEMCGRIGLVTKKGLAALIKQRFSKTALTSVIGLLFIANVINIGADLGAMASASALVVGGPFVAWLVAITVLTLVLEIYVSYPRYARYLKYLTLSLFAYVFAAFVVKQDWATVLLSTIKPTFSTDKAYLMNIVAILGTTISPYLFFWQTTEEVEDERQHHFKVTPRIISWMRKDTSLGVFFSNAITFFIITTTAATLGAHGITTINTADQAAAALRPLSDAFASLLFALGIIGTGLLAVPILAASAAYAIAEVFSWSEGLNKRFYQAKKFYRLIALSLILGALINFIHIPPFRMLYYAAVVNGICAPPLIVFIIFLANDGAIMGQFKNSWRANTLGWATAATMGVAALALLWQLTLGGGM